MNVPDHVIGTTRSEQDLVFKYQINLKNSHDILYKVPVEAYCGLKKLHFIYSHDDLMSAFRILIEHQFQSVPVFEVSKQQFIGFLDVTDLVVHFLSVFRKMKETEMNDDETNNLIHNQKCGELAGLATERKFIKIVSSTPTKLIIEKFVKWNVRRLPVVNADGGLLGHVSQFAVLEFLQPFAYLFDCSKKTIGEYQLGYKDVYSLIEAEKVGNAFELMVQHKVSAIAILNHQKKIVGNISASDVKYLLTKNGNIDLTKLENYLVEFKRETFYDKKVVSQTNKQKKKIY
jgi:CBS domain-containing protein